MWGLVARGPACPFRSRYCFCTIYEITVRSVDRRQLRREVASGFTRTVAVVGRAGKDRAVVSEPEASGQHSAPRPTARKTALGAHSSKDAHSLSEVSRLQA